jgi:hypothetical protein
MLISDWRAIMSPPEGHPGQHAYTFLIRILSTSLISVSIFSVCCYSSVSISMGHTPNKPETCRRRRGGHLPWDLLYTVQWTYILISLSTLYHFLPFISKRIFGSMHAHHLLFSCIKVRWYFRPSFVNCCSVILLSGSTLPSPLPCVNKYTVYTYTVCNGGYGVPCLRQINTCSKVPLQVHFF